MLIEDYTLENRINNQYFIDPYGEVIKYKPTEEKIENKDICSIHCNLAKQILIEMSGNSNYSPFSSEKSLLLRMGYVIVGSLGNELPFCTREPTQAQIDKLFELGYIFSKTYPHTDEFNRITTAFYFKKYKI